jgi:hypothetical protein
MLSIQDVGLSIMSDEPKNLYILGGSEYGIKEKYIEILESKIGPRMDYSEVLEFISFMTKKHIIPLKPQVYVVRYDKVFVSKLSKDISDKLSKLPIIGTLVVIYDDDASINKIDKFFPDNTAVINGVGPKHIAKYIKADYSNLDDDTIYTIATNTSDYYQAKNIARCLNCVQGTVNLTNQEICSLFGLTNASTMDAIQIAIASRNYVEFVKLVDSFDGDFTQIIYLIMNTMTEFDKLLDNKYASSPVKKYADKWTRPDIYYMFNHAYRALDNIRSGSTANIQDVLLYLGALMKFEHIPDLEVLA